jgi:hypothetical protein
LASTNGSTLATVDSSAIDSFLEPFNWPVIRCELPESMTKLSLPFKTLSIGPCEFPCASKNTIRSAENVPLAWSVFSEIRSSMLPSATAPLSCLILVDPPSSKITASAIRPPHGWAESPTRSALENGFTSLRSLYLVTDEAGQFACSCSRAARAAAACVWTARLTSVVIAAIA